MTMPNGGSDCCGTCWFNSRNKADAAKAEATRASQPATCTIRSLAIEKPFWTYCANHPHRRPQRDPVPIGPVFVHNDAGGRTLWQPSPDTPQVREHLLSLLGEISEKPASEYPIGIYADEVVVWQLGEFREAGATAELQRIASFDPDAGDDSPFQRTRLYLVALAREALAKIAAAG
jgi:hypothetical protein